MISKFLVNSYELLVEIALWGYFLCSAILGLYANGFLGLIFALLASFVVAILFVAPFLLIGDIRARVKHIEEIKAAGR